MAEVTTSTRCTVNRQLLPVKGVYFCFMAAVGDLLPFIPIIMKQLGLSSTEMGIIYGVMPFITFFVRPVFGAVADKTRKHKLVLIFCILMTGLCYGLLLVTPKAPKQPESGRITVSASFQCNPQDSYFRDCSPVYQGNDSMSQKLPAKNVCDMSLPQYADNLASQNNTTAVSCYAVCSQQIVLSNVLNVCFLGDAGQFSSNCNTTRKFSGKDDSLTFTVDDLNTVVSHEVIGDRLVTDSLLCKDYDLKYVTYEDSKFYQMTCDSEAILDCVLQCDVQHAEECPEKAARKLSRTFWTFFTIFFFCNVFFSPVISLIDAIAYDILGEERGKWGRQRLWGTIGFSLLAITSTFIMDSVSQTQEIDYSISFYIFIGLIVVAAVVAYFLRFSDTLKCSQMFKNLSKLFRYPEIVVFLILVMLFGAMHSIPEVLLFWYLQEMGSSQVTLGLCIVSNCSMEMVVLFVAGKLIKKIGHVSCLYLALIVYAIRFFSYSFLTNPWYVLPVELLHGVTFGLSYAALSGYGSLISPQGMSATVQGLIGGLHFGFGKGIGSLVSGKLFDRNGGLGPVWTFRTFGFFALFLLLVYFLINILCFRKQQAERYPTKQQAKKTGDSDLSHAGDMLLGNNRASNLPTTEL